MLPELEFVAVRHGLVEAGDRHCLVERADDLKPVFFLEREIGFHVVAMVMGGENVGEFPAAAGGRFEDRLFLRRVDRGRQPAFRIVHENAVIIAAA